MKYEIVRDTDPEQLAKRVEELWRAGWTIQGGVSIAARVEHENSNYIRSWLVYAQAMVLP